MRILTFLMSILILSCASPEKENAEVAGNNNITKAEEYNAYLDKRESNNTGIQKKSFEFWKKKYDADTANFIALYKMSSGYSGFFSVNGDIEDLIASEKALIKVNEQTRYNKAGYLRALARNYISQHKFKEARDLLLKAEENGQDIESTQKMLFDVYLELGNEAKAKEYLEKVKNINDFTYLIRTSKWNDHQGNLDGAIKYLEKATKKAEENKNEQLMAWCYTNIADYYGHAGEIEKSYNHYLKALKLDSSNAYAKKGIAWIVFSKERNSEEANRILDKLIASHNSPDYYLMKAEIAEYNGEEAKKEEYLDKFLEKTNNPLYGDMYNKYLVMIYAEDSSKQNKAIELAQREVENRPTPQSYDLLAWALYKSGNLEKAYEVGKNQVYGHTSEPEPLMHFAMIAKEHGDKELVEELKPELEGAYYELGPMAEKQIKQL